VLAVVYGLGLIADVVQAPSRRPIFLRYQDRRGIFFDSPEPPGPENHPVALDEALGALEQISPRQARVIELRFFGGLSHEETAEVLQVSAGTVKRDWTLARASLYCELVKSERGN
jgi:DNA-directed RNA polymerase specialized sigma24 family protein